MEKEKKITAVLIFEIIGKPKEHLVQTLDSIIKKIGEEKGVEVKEKKVKEPVLMKNQKEFYTTFAEVEVEVDEILYIAMLMFKYMPAHIEVVSPEIISLTNNGWGEILSELTRRLHRYDEVARIIKSEKNILEKKLRELMPKKEDNPEKDKK
jgi:hypothetical protein